MKKIESVAIQMNLNDLQNKGILNLYKRLQKNGNLERFARQAFTEKANRYLNGLDEQYADLHNLIKTKGIRYILDAVQEKETPVTNAADDGIEKAAQQILQALMNLLQNNMSLPPVSTGLQLHAIGEQKNKPDLEKLKALL